MCVGIPGKVIKIDNKKAQIEQGDHCHWVDTSPLNEEVEIGDYLITYQEVAINKISKKDAEEVLSLMDSTSYAGVKCSD